MVVPRFTFTRDALQIPRVVEWALRWYEYPVLHVPSLAGARAARDEFWAKLKSKLTKGSASGSAHTPPGSSRHGAGTRFQGWTAKSADRPGSAYVLVVGGKSRKCCSARAKRRRFAHPVANTGRPQLHSNHSFSPPDVETPR